MLYVNVSQVRRSKRTFVSQDNVPGDEWKGTESHTLHARKADSLLVELIAEQGILTPIEVRKRGDFFVIVDGNRRFDAAMLCGLTQIPIQFVN